MPFSPDSRNREARQDRHAGRDPLRGACPQARPAHGGMVLPWARMHHCARSSFLQAFSGTTLDGSVELAQTLELRAALEAQ